MWKFKLIGLLMTIVYWVFSLILIQRDDEHLSLRLWRPTSKPIFDLPGTMNTSTRSDLTAPKSDFRSSLGLRGIVEAQIASRLAQTPSP